MKWRLVRHREKLRQQQLEKDSEAMGVSLAIFKAMQKEVQLRAREFVVVLLPTHRDFALLRENPERKRQWNALKGKLQERQLHILDLLPDLEQLPSIDFHLNKCKAFR
jgi:hypothetical protein